MHLHLNFTCDKCNCSKIVDLNPTKEYWNNVLLNLEKDGWEFELAEFRIVKTLCPKHHHNK